MTAPVEDVTELPGKTVLDQYDEPIGEIEEIYAIGGDGHPTWVTVDVRPDEEGGTSRTVFIPLARLKLEDGDLQVPYSVEHLTAGPEIEPADELSEEDEGALRAYYSVGVGDAELTTDNFSYATLVPEEDGPSKRVKDVGRLETPNADKRTDETRERLQDPGPSESRHITADDVVDDEDIQQRREARAEAVEDTPSG
jgi:hypothetical protein